MIGIYKITNPIGYVYVGQSKNIKNRFATHKYNFKKQVKQWGKINSSFNTYGFQNHFFEVIEECSIELLNERERYWQEFYNSIEKGLNSVINKDKNNKTKYSEFSKKTMSLKAKGKIFSEQQKTKMSIKRKGAKNPKAKIVLDLQNGIFYETMKEVRDLYKIPHQRISKMLNGKINNTTNLIFV